MVQLGQEFAARGQWGPVVFLVVAVGGLLVVGGALAWWDARSHLLPDRLTVILACVLVPPLALAALWAGEPGRVLRALAAAAVLGGLFALVHVASPRSLGFGDVKLSPVLGFLCGFLSWGHLVLAGVTACLVAGLWSGVVLARRGRSAHVPLGPPLLAGALAALAL